MYIPYSDILYDILSGIYSDVLSGIYSDILSDMGAALRKPRICKLFAALGPICTLLFTTWKHGLSIVCCFSI